MPARPPKKTSDQVKVGTYLSTKAKAKLDAMALIRKLSSANIIETGVDLFYRQLSAEDRKLVDQIVQRTEAEL